MEHDPSPLKYLGTQSAETVALAAALALRTTDHPGNDLPVASESRARESRLGAAASWAMDKAADGLQSTARAVGRRAGAALGDYTRRDPVRAMLIAAGAGALLMTVMASMARSGKRRVGRSLRIS